MSFADFEPVDGVTILAKVGENVFIDFYKSRERFIQIYELSGIDFACEIYAVEHSACVDVFIGEENGNENLLAMAQEYGEEYLVELPEESV